MAKYGLHGFPFFMGLEFWRKAWVARPPRVEPKIGSEGGNHTHLKKSMRLLSVL